MKKKKKRPISEDKTFMETCNKLLAMYATCSSDTKRCFIGGTSEFGNNCLIFFRGDVDDIFAVQEFLHKREKK